MATLTVHEIYSDENPGIMLQALELMGREVWGWQAGAELDHSQMKRIFAANTPEGDVLAAGALMLPEDSAHGYISELATHPNHRGRGLGRKVLAMMETVARDAGALQISTTPMTGEADSFFLHLGYRPEEMGSNDLVKEL